MRILKLLSSLMKTTKKSTQYEIKENTHKVPTIEPEQELYDCYDEIFGTMINDIPELSSNDIDNIYRIIKGCEGGFLNLSGYMSEVWENHFKDKDWHWRRYYARYFCTY